VSKFNTGSLPLRGNPAGNDFPENQLQKVKANQDQNLHNL